MKRVNNIYYKVCDINNIMDMAHKVCLNTKNKNKVDRFETFYAEEIISIKNTMEKRKYSYISERDYILASNTYKGHLG